MRLTAVLVSVTIILAFDLVASYCLYYNNKTVMGSLEFTNIPETVAPHLYRSHQKHWMKFHY